MTKVLRRPSPMLIMATLLLAGVAAAQEAHPAPDCPQKPADLYSRLRTLPLDGQRVFRIRGAFLDRPNLHFDFEEGTLAFTSDVCGRLTGAMFEGEGEILLRPPDKVERESMALFTGMAILEEPFSSAYLRFNDDTAAQLQPYLSPVPDGGEFVQKWKDTSLALAQSDALRLLLDFSKLLPSGDQSSPPRAFSPMLHAHLLGRSLGPFEVYFDSALSESLWAGQPRIKEGVPFFDIWTSFRPANIEHSSVASASVGISEFRIQAAVQPPTSLKATAELDLHIKRDGERMLLFELSRFLKVDAVHQDGHPLDFIQNQALEGTELQRKGNDLVAVIFPAPLRSGQEFKMTFRYAGDVLSDAGGGLLYVGERGTWYPNLGLSPAQFDMQFSYPAGWTLLATGKPLAASAVAAESGLQSSHWISEGRIPVAGFNLGKYMKAEARAGEVAVDVYATKVVERSFPKAPPQILETPKGGLPRSLEPPPIVISPTAPSPARNAQNVAVRAADAITSFSQWFGPYPFSSLSLTQMPGDLSQGWPGLIFLSSFAFLSREERGELHLDPLTSLLDSQVLVHETAHQWWGDLVLWKTYRDQWFSEGLANYSSLLVLEQQNPSQFRAVLQHYRDDLLTKNKDGEPIREAGPVTLGTRLTSSHFPEGYEAISYERGTWLFHMLRCMLRDAEATSHSRNGRPNPEEPFFRVLRRVSQRYAGQSITTRELLTAFEENLPRALWYENHRKLDWFMDSWVHGTAIPRFEVRDVKIAQKEHGVTVSGTMLQKDAPEDLVTAVPIYAVHGSDSRSLIGQVLADGAETSFHFSAPAGTRKILIDPEQTILTAPK